MKQSHHPVGSHATSINSNWYKHDKRSYEGSKIDAIISQFSLQQLIKEPTHILTDSSSCIDLVFTSQPNLVMKSRVHFLFLRKVLFVYIQKIDGSSH